MNITELRSKSLEIANKARALLNEITEENRSDKEAEFDRMMVESDGLAASAERAERAEARSREFDSVDPAAIVADNVTVEVRSNVSNEEKRAKAVASYLRGEIGKAELRAQNVGTDENGGYTVPTALNPGVIETMKAFGPLNDGTVVNYIDTAGGGTINFPTNDDTGNTASQVAEGTDLGDADDLTFGQIGLGAYKITSGVVLVSNELITDSAIDVVDFVHKAIAKRLGRKLNALLTTGNGTNAPGGLITGAGAGVTTALTNAITFDELIDQEHSVDPAYRANGEWMFNDSFVKVVRKLKDAEGRYIWQPSGQVGVPSLLNGRRYYINQAVSEIGAGNRVAVFGDLSQFTVRRAGGIVIRRLNERYAEKDQVGFVGLARVDSAVMDPAAIKALIMRAA